MSTFKISKKEHLSDTRSTINDLHEKRMSYFEQERAKLDEYTNELECLTALPEKTYADNCRIEFLQERVESITDDKELNEYLLDFMTILSNNNDNQESFTPKKGKMDTFINSTINTSKASMYNEYITQFNPEIKPIHVEVSTRQICVKCQSESFMYEIKNSMDICTQCGTTVTFLNDENENVYSVNNEPVILFNYKRNNHFQECLNQLQAKENTTIPQRIFDDLTAEFKKYNITDPKMLSVPLVKSYLKKLRYNKYYEHIPTIINQFCGIRAPKMTPELEQQLKIMFDEIQSPFEKYSALICPNRKNFLNYNYVFYKMCELLNKDEFLPHFPLLKSREKLYEHDKIWKGICETLRWEYIPSI
jgi:hypothetical protein